MVAPDVPVTVTLKVPSAAVLVAFRVRVLAPPVVLDGLKEAVTPLGKVEAVRLMVPVKPKVGVTVIVLWTLPPCVSVKALGLAANVNPGTPAVSANFTGVNGPKDAVIVYVPALLGSV